MASPTSSLNATSPPPSSLSSSNAVTPPTLPPEELATELPLPPHSPLAHLNTEPVEDYRPGGFHPVHFGDLLHHGQYKIVRKLGYGAFSTVWLAKDTLNSRYVAVKIKTAETSMDSSELSILSYLKQQGSSDWMSRHVITLLDSFEQHGPNGKHVCIVFEALGASISGVLDCNSEYYHGALSLFPTWMAKSILRQILTGICFLHSHGVIHGDIHLNNILFEVPSLDSYTVKDFERGDSSQLETRPGGRLDKWAPRYLSESLPLTEHPRNGPGFTVKITDLGGAFISADKSKNPATHKCLRAPERLFESSLDQSIDIWSFGCLVYELLTGLALFPVFPGDHDDCQILSIIDQLGPLPARLFSRWGRSHMYYRSNGEQFNSVVDGPCIELEKDDPFETRFHEEKACDIDDNEEDSVMDLLRQILRYEPKERPCAEELLSHPWFADNGS